MTPDDMTQDEAEKLAKVEEAYRRRFDPKGKVHVVKGGGGYAYATDEISLRKARYDISAWRVRFVELVTKGR